MQVKILYYGLLRKKVGKRTEFLEIAENSSLFSLISKLSDNYHIDFEDFLLTDNSSRLDPNLIITVNGVAQDITHIKDTTLFEGDTISFMTLISGG